MDAVKTASAQQCVLCRKDVPATFRVFRPDNGWAPACLGCSEYFDMNDSAGHWVWIDLAWTPAFATEQLKRWEVVARSSATTALCALATALEDVGLECRIPETAWGARAYDHVAVIEQARRAVPEQW